MKVETVKVERTKNYETIGLTLSIQDDASAEDAIKAARGFIAAQFGETPTDDEVAKAKQTIAASEYKKL